MIKLFVNSKSHAIESQTETSKQVSTKYGHPESWLSGDSRNSAFWDRAKTLGQVWVQEMRRERTILYSIFKKQTYEK